VISTTQTGPYTVTQFPFDASKFPGATFKFKAVMLVASASDTLSLNLINYTDAVTVTTFTSVSTTPDYQSVTLTAPTNLPNSEKQYYVTIQRTGGISSDAVTVLNCYLEVSY
jgi:hypothetical protein